MFNPKYRNTKTFGFGFPLKLLKIQIKKRNEKCLYLSDREERFDRPQTPNNVQCTYEQPKPYCYTFFSPELSNFQPEPYTPCKTFDSHKYNIPSREIGINSYKMKLPVYSKPIVHVKTSRPTCNCT